MVHYTVYILFYVVSLLLYARGPMHASALLLPVVGVVGVLVGTVTVPAAVCKFQKLPSTKSLCLALLLVRKSSFDLFGTLTLPDSKPLAPSP